MKIQVLHVTYKYGEVREEEFLNFNSLKEAKAQIESWTKIGDKPDIDDFIDFDEPIEAYNYHLYKWKHLKDATKESCKWFQEFYYKGELIGSGEIDC